MGIHSSFDSLFKLATKNVESQLLIEVNEIDLEDYFKCYHGRFGHQNKGHVKKMISENLNINVDRNSEFCEGGIYGKAPRPPFYSPGLHSQET